MAIKVDITVDASGLRCPEPLMVTRNKLMDMASGEVIKIIATDPSTSWDFPNFCKFLNHELIQQEETGDQYCYWIRKG
ncbi:MAG: sulfurtransferase TusA [Gammaproteobacteria bacterium]|jgi:tRNA 2-thiouridine synthesizing protein A|nr:sulfurtransferase TusA [Gammaproteobacteria bacterium]|tara:strand:- start:1633 stop:1866 length:234 start_codon:yes stop_codon:yes gene_type:complete